MNERGSGIVKYINDAKGFGFIQRDCGDDVIVHYSNILGVGFRSLSEGQRVEFEVEQSEKGLQARNVYIVDILTSISW